MGQRKAYSAGFALLTCVLVVSGVVLLNSKTTEPPSPALADHIDRLLAQNECVGSIESWASRKYVWGYNFWTNSPLGERWLGSDKSVVHVTLYRSENDRLYPPGRHLLRADQNQLIFDDNPDLYFAYGKYDVETQRLTIFHCGPNYPPKSQ